MWGNTSASGATGEQVTCAKLTGRQADRGTTFNRTMRAPRHRFRGECFRPLRRHRGIVWLVIFALLFADIPVPLAPLVSWAASVAFDPEDFVRTTAKPETVLHSFTVSDPTASYTLCLANGGDYG